jgi:Anti-sigma factor NepR
LSSDDKKDGRRGRKSDNSGNSEDPNRMAKKKRPASPEVGHALRSVYQRTVDETIPPEMLDLLGKLG